MRIEARRIRGVGCDRHRGLQSSSYEIGRGARCLDLRVVPRGGGLRGLDGSAPGADGAGRRPDTAPRPRRRTHLGREAGVGEAPAGSVGHPGPAVPRDRAGERLLERRGRVLRHRHRGLRQADDDDPACRLRDDRPADVHRLRTEQAGRSPAATAAADLRRRARRLLDRRRRHPAQAALQRRHVRRRRARRRRRSRIPHMARARDHAGQRALAATTALRQGPHADPVRPGTRRLRTVLRLRTAGRGLRRLARPSALGHRLGPERRSPITSPPTSRSPSLPRTAATARTAPTTRGSPTTSSAGSRTATTPSSPRTSTQPACAAGASPVSMAAKPGSRYRAAEAAHDILPSGEGLDSGPNEAAQPVPAFGSAPPAPSSDSPTGSGRLRRHGHVAVVADA